MSRTMTGHAASWADPNDADEVFQTLLDMIGDPDRDDLKMTAHCGHNERTGPGVLVFIDGQPVGMTLDVADEIIKRLNALADHGTTERPDVYGGLAVGILDRADLLREDMAMPDPKPADIGRMKATIPEEVMKNLSPEQAEAVMGFTKAIEGLTPTALMEMITGLEDGTITEVQLPGGVKIEQGEPRQ